MTASGPVPSAVWRFVSHHYRHVGRYLEAVFLVRGQTGVFVRNEALTRRAPWHGFCRFSKYANIAANATRQGLKESERAAAERRGFQALRYQEWKDGKPGEQVRTASGAIGAVG